MQKILIIFAHPAIARSKINRALRHAVETIDGVYVHDLYANYPDFMIDVKREQALCEAHDIIIFQHPFYWYATPAIIKEWLDLVLEHGWAYGSNGNALKGKIFFQALSAGGDATTYQKDGYNKFTLTELTSPLQATANLCKMIWLPPFAVTGIHKGLAADDVAAHAKQYQRTIMALRDGRVDFEQARKSSYLNSDLAHLITES